MRLDEIGGAVEQTRALVRGRCIPGDRSRAGALQRVLDLILGRLADGSDDLPPVCRTANFTARAHG